MAGSVNPQNPNVAHLVQALFLVTSVRRDLEALLPEAQARGSVSVPFPRLQRWQNRLQQALDQLNQIAVILIFPPPPIATFVNAARTEITAALDLLRAVPTTQIFPPSLSMAMLSLQTLQTAVGQLRQAEADLVRAIQSA